MAFCLLWQLIFTVCCFFCNFLRFLSYFSSSAPSLHLASRRFTSLSFPLNLFFMQQNVFLLCDTKAQFFPALKIVVLHSTAFPASSQCAKRLTAQRTTASGHCASWCPPFVTRSGKLALRKRYIVVTEVFCWSFQYEQSSHVHRTIASFTAGASKLRPAKLFHPSANTFC